MTGDLPGGQQFATVGRRPTHRDEFNAWLIDVAQAAVAADLTPVEYAAVVLTPLHAGGHPDEDVWHGTPVVRPVLAALEEAGVLVGVDPEHLCSIEWRAPIVCGQDGLLVEVHDVTLGGDPMKLRHLLVEVTPDMVAALTPLGDPSIAGVSAEAGRVLADAVEQQ